MDYFGGGVDTFMHNVYFDTKNKLSVIFLSKKL